MQLSLSKKVDKTLLHESVDKDAQKLFAGQRLKNINVEIPVETIEPEITTESVNDLGIKELLGSGTSLFQRSQATNRHMLSKTEERCSVTEEECARYLQLSSERF